MFYDSLRILFLGFVSVIQIHCAASSSNEASIGEFNESRRELNRQLTRGATSDDHLSFLLAKYQTRLPTEGQAHRHIEAIKFRHPEWAHEFTRKISHLQNPCVYKGIRYPSRMIYHGPSGCGKTYTTLALAKVCGMECLLIPGSSVETSYRRSGPEFLEALFQTLLNYPERRFLIVFDELKVLAQYSKDERDTHQHATVTKLWQCLDAIEKQRHICVVGTDNFEPTEYETQIQTRFFNSIFKFNRADASSAAGLSMLRLEVIKENSLSGSVPCSSSSGLTNLQETSRLDSTQQLYIQQASVKSLERKFTDKQLERYLAGVLHLTDREKIELMQSAAEIAIFQELNSPTESSEIAIKECHLDEAFKKYRQNCIQRFLKHSIVQQLCSVRALSYYIAAASFGLRIYDPIYIPHSTKLLFAAQCVNALDPNNKDKLRDSQLFNALNTIVEFYESHQRYCEGLRRQQAALAIETERYDQSRKDLAADLEIENARHEQSQKDRTRALDLEVERHDQSRKDLAADLEIEDARHEQLRTDRKKALDLEAERHGQSRKDLVEDEKRQMEQFRADRLLALRGQYVSGVDMVLDILNQSLLSIQSIKNPHQRASAIENAWPDVERQLLHELRHRQHEIDYTEGLWGTPLSDFNKKLVIAFYNQHGRVIPDTIKRFVG